MFYLQCITVSELSYCNTYFVLRHTICSPPCHASTPLSVTLTPLSVTLTPLSRTLTPLCVTLTPLSVTLIPLCVTLTPLSGTLLTQLSGTLLTPLSGTLTPLIILSHTHCHAERSRSVTLTPPCVDINSPLCDINSFYNIEQCPLSC